eukprot:COSAG04_NODE_7696_length_1085_cov_6.925963_1_plen_87_part_00
MLAGDWQRTPGDGSLLRQLAAEGTASPPSARCQPASGGDASGSSGGEDIRSSARELEGETGGAPARMRATSRFAGAAAELSAQQAR